MLNYVRIELGDIPDRFTGREKDFYRCIAFAAVMLANHRNYTGYKEIESCVLNWEDLNYLGLISNPSAAGAFFLKCENKVTYKQIKRAKMFYLDTSCIKVTKVSDVLITKEPMWLYDEARWNDFDTALVAELPKETIKSIKKKIEFDLLDIPAQEYVDKIVTKRIQSQGKWRNVPAFQTLSPEKQDYFIKHQPKDLDEAYRLLSLLNS